MISARWIVLDIEGTVSSTDQVLGMLHGYARPRLGPRIEDHPTDPVVVEAVRELGGLTDPSTDAVVAVLHGRMDRDHHSTG